MEENEVFKVGTGRYNVNGNVTFLSGVHYVLREKLKGKPI